MANAVKIAPDDPSLLICGISGIHPGGAVPVFTEFEIYYPAATLADWNATLAPWGPNLAAFTGGVTDELEIYTNTEDANPLNSYIDNYTYPNMTGLAATAGWHTIQYGLVANGATGHLVVDGVDVTYTMPSSVSGINAVRWGLRFANSGNIVYLGRLKIGTTLGGSEILEYTPATDGDFASFLNSIGDPAFTTTGTVTYEDAPEAPPSSGEGGGGGGETPGTRARFYTGYPWRFLLINLADWRALMCLDTFAYEKSGTLRLRGPSVFTGKTPSDDPRVYLEHGDDPFLAEGVRGLIGLRREGGTPKWKCRYAGLILQVQDEADANPVTTYTAYDPWQYLYARPVRDGDGDLPDKDGLDFNAAGNTIALALLQRTIDADGECFIDVDTGTFETTATLDLTFQPATSVGEAWDQLCNTGSLDIVLKPIWDPVNRPGKLVQLNIYAQAGADKDGAVFAWGRAPYSLARIGRLEDGTKRANKIQPYAGDAAHPVTLQTHAGSVTKYGEWWAQEILTEQPVDTAAEALMQERLRLVKNGQTVVTINPFPERSPIPFLDYDRGDRVKVIAPKTLRKAINGFQRVYAIPVTIGDDQIETIDSLLTSADAGTA